MSRRDAGDLASAELLSELLAGADVAVPEAAHPELSELAGLARALSVVSAQPDLRDAFRAGLRDRLVAEAVGAKLPIAVIVRTRVADATTRARTSLRTAIAGFVAAATIGSAGVAAAAQSALPGDLLYGIKRGTESVRLAFADGSVSEGTLHLELSDRRLFEVEHGLDQVPSALLKDTLDDMDDASLAGSELLLTAFQQTADVALADRVLAHAVDHQTRLNLLLRGRLPLDVVSSARTSLENARRIEADASELRDGPCANCGPSSPNVPVVDPSVPPVGVPPVVITPAGEGPARPELDPCCVEPEEEPLPPPFNGEPSPPPPDPEPTPTTDPSPPPGPVDLPPPLDPVEDVVNDVIDGVVDEVPPPLDEPVEDIVDTIGDILSDATNGAADVAEEAAEGDVPGAVAEAEETVEDLLPGGGEQPTSDQTPTVAGLAPDIGLTGQRER